MLTPNQKEDFADNCKKSLHTFFSLFSLYQKFEISEVYAYLDNHREISFESYCEVDETFTTFSFFESDGQSLIKTIQDAARYVTNNATFAHKFCKHFRAVCQSCQKSETHILLRGFGLKDNDACKFYIEKGGQLPEFQIKPDELFKNYFGKANSDLYRKGKALIKVNYGIGALAYWRRNIEYIIHKIIDFKISNDPFAKPILELALNDYKNNRVMQKLLESIKLYVPKEILLPNGENPLNLLYEKSSEGLHGLSDQECTDMTVNLEELMKYVIRKFNSSVEDKLAAEALNRLKQKK